MLNQGALGSFGGLSTLELSELEVQPACEILYRGAERFDDVEAVGADPEGRMLGVNAADAGEAGERVSACRDELRGTVLSEQAHHDENVLGADREIHRAPHCGDGLCGTG